MERHNATISYCFLAVFMLISRDERFSGKFVRSHARYATMIHLAFLVLIVILVKSRNFESIILYDVTWINIVLLLCFSGLLVLLGVGMYHALMGK